MDLAVTGLLYGLGTMLLLTYLQQIRDLRWWLLGTVPGLILLLPWPGLRAGAALLQIAPAQGALLLGLGMGLLLVKGGRPRLLVFGAGLLSTAWISMLLPLWPAPLALGLPLAAVAATILLQLRSTEFASAAVHQDACLLLLILGLVLGLFPDIRDGWASAAALQAGDNTEATQQQSVQGALLITAASMVLGLLYKRWRYR